MTTLLGPIGGLIDIKCPSKLSRPSGGVSYTTSTSVTGRRVNAQLQGQRRIWNLETSVLAPQDMAALEAFIYGGFGSGPWYFVPADAPGANLLTPWDSLMWSASHRLVGTAPAKWAAAGGTTMPDGTVVPGSLLRVDPTATAPILHAKAIPVPRDGSKVTLSLWAAGAGTQLRYRWADASGNQTGSWSGSGSAVSGATLERISVTVTPPSTAYGVFVAVDATATRAAGAQVTWTDELYPYGPGRGCTSAILDHAATETVLAVRGNPSWGRYDTASYVVTELG